MEDCLGHIGLWRTVLIMLIEVGRPPLSPNLDITIGLDTGLNGIEREGAEQQTYMHLFTLYSLLCGQ